MLKRITIGLFAFGLVCSVIAPVWAGEGYDASLTLSVTQNKGNTDSSLGSVALLGERKTDEREFRAGLEFMYGELDGEKNTENGKVFAGLKELFTDRFYGAVDASAMYDPIAEVDYRALWSAGLGYFLIKNEVTSLSVDAGPAYVWEKVGGVTDHYPAVRTAQRYERALSDTAKVWQSLEYVPQADDFDNYLLAGEVGIEAMLNSHLSLRSVYKVIYDNEPAEGAQKSDRQLLVGVVIAL